MGRGKGFVYIAGRKSQFWRAWWDVQTEEPSTLESYSHVNDLIVFLPYRKDLVIKLAILFRISIYDSIDYKYSTYVRRTRMAPEVVSTKECPIVYTGIRNIYRLYL